MFDISWSEFMLIGVVALIVIGPKELPGVLRTLGQYTRKVRSMAAEFQSQFQEAMREAEMADLKKQVDDMASDIKNYDPLKEVRTGVESLGADLEKSGTQIQQSLDQPAALPPGEPQAALPPTEPGSSEPQAAEPTDGPAGLPDAGTVAPVEAAPSPEPAAAAPASEPVSLAPESATPERAG